MLGLAAVSFQDRAVDANWALFSFDANQVDGAAHDGVIELFISRFCNDNRRNGYTIW